MYIQGGMEDPGRTGRAMAGSLPRSLMSQAGEVIILTILAWEQTLPLITIGGMETR